MSARADDTAKDWGEAISGPGFASLSIDMPRASLHCRRMVSL
jgi:hypothetical protein